MHSHHNSEGAPTASGPEDPIAAAKARREQDQQILTEACAAELQEVLRKYGMTLEVTPAQIVLAPRS